MLAAVVDRARAAWPDLVLPTDGFAAHVAGLLGKDADAASLHAGDLYVAYGCSVGDTAALAIFEQHFMPKVTAYLQRGDALARFGDDLKQQLRARLLLADGPVLPRIASYTGRGPMGAWLRVTAARLAINMRASERPTVPFDEDAPAGYPAREDPELAYLRTQYGAVLREATRDALAALEPRDATILRLFFLESMTQVAIGRLLRMSERTVRRSVLDARERILSFTRKRLSERLALPETQLDTILRLARDELRPSIVEVLGKPKG